jgi:hypothetical protein
MAVGQSPINFYELLGVSASATTEEIRAAYRERIAHYHPDRNRWAHATAVAALINEAWDVLGNPERRRLYDAEMPFGASGEREEAREARSENENREPSSAATPGDPPPPAAPPRQKSDAPKSHEGGIIGFMRQDPLSSAIVDGVVAILLTGLVFLMATVGSLLIYDDGNQTRAAALAGLVVGLFWAIWAGVRYRKLRLQSDPIVWVCSQCGRHVPPHAAVCRCGLKRPDSDTSARGSEAKGRTPRAQEPVNMPTVGRWLFGYRDDVNLSARWWHRGFVLLFVLVMVLTATLALAVKAEYIFQAVLFSLGIALLLLNVYYRGFIYIVCGSRATLRNG